MSSGSSIIMPLRPQSVASFYAEFQKCLAALGVSVEISAVPVEISDPIPFAKDEQHHSYDPEYAHRFWRVLTRADGPLQAILLLLHRQSQSGPFLLGQLRPCGHTLLRPPRAQT